MLIIAWWWSFALAAPHAPSGDDDRPFALTGDTPEARAAEAERRRLGEEIVAHAAAGRHGPLGRTYVALLALTDDIPDELHLLAADAALASGRVELAVARLQRVPEGPHRARAEESLADLRARYGLVRLSSPAGTEMRCPPRFVPDERACLQAAHDDIAARGWYAGLLPVGDCTLGDQAFTVSPDGSVDLVVPQL